MADAIAPPMACLRCLIGAALGSMNACAAIGGGAIAGIPGGIPGGIAGAIAVGMAGGMPGGIPGAGGIGRPPGGGSNACLARDDSSSHTSVANAPGLPPYAGASASTCVVGRLRRRLACSASGNARV